MIDLSGTSYLNFDRFDPVAEGAVLRTSNSATRNSAADFGHLRALERSLATDFTAEDACVLSSGYLAGIALNDVLLGDKAFAGTLLFESSAHSCSSVISRHLGPKRTVTGAAPSGAYTVVLDAADPLCGFANTGFFDDAVPRAATRIAVDCSHTAFLWEDHPRQNTGAEIVYFGSLAKAGAFPAGFIAGPQGLIDAVRGREIYGASGPPAQWMAERLLRRAEDLANRRALLRDYVAHVDARLGRPARADWFPAYRITGDADAIAKDFMQHGFALSRVRYPTPSSPESVRAVLNTGLTWEHIRTIGDLMARHAGSILITDKRKPAFVAYTS